MTYKKVLLKFSGEALNDSGKNGNFDRERMVYIAREIRSTLREFPELQLALMPGGGNHGRGSELISKYGFDQLSADAIGMTYTVVNAVALRSVLQQEMPDTEIRVMSKLSYRDLAEDYLPVKALHHMKKGRLVIFAAGSGEGAMSTDSAAVTRAIVLGMDAVFKGTKEKGVFNCDPRKNDCAEFLPRVTNKEFIDMDLEQIFDYSAVAAAGKKKLPIHIFDIRGEGNLQKLLRGEKVGTLITN